MRHELSQLVGPQDHLEQRICDQAAVRGQPSHLAHQEQRNVPQFHLRPGLDRQRGDLLRTHLGNQGTQPLDDGDAALVELVLPQHAGEHGAPQRLLGGQDSRARSLVGAGHQGQGAAAAPARPSASEHSASWCNSSLARTNSEVSRTRCGRPPLRGGRHSGIGQNLV